MKIAAVCTSAFSWKSRTLLHICPRCFAGFEYPCLCCYFFRFKQWSVKMTKATFSGVGTVTGPHWHGSFSIENNIHQCFTIDIDGDESRYTAFNHCIMSIGLTPSFVAILQLPVTEYWTLLNSRYLPDHSSLKSWWNQSKLCLLSYKPLVVSYTKGRGREHKVIMFKIK